MGTDLVAALAKAADLPLPDDRREAVAAQLGVWLAAANELNRKMSAAPHLTVTPATVFTHPDAGEQLSTSESRIFEPPAPFQVPGLPAGRLLRPASCGGGPGRDLRRQR